MHPRDRKMIGTMIAACIVGVVFVVAFPALAQTGIEGNLAQFGAESAIGTEASVPIIIARIIRAVFALAGIVMVVLVIVAGFIWMTAGGNEEKIETAKKLLRNAVIGLAIALAAFAIAHFIIRALLGATQGGDGTVTGPGGGAGGGIGGAQAAYYVDISPQGKVPIRNVSVYFIFSKPTSYAAQATLGGAFKVFKTTGDGVTFVSYVDGTFTQESEKVIKFTPSFPCPPPNETMKCFDANTNYAVFMSGAVKSKDGSSLICDYPKHYSCKVNFTTGALVDTSPPQGTITEPNNGESVPAESLVPVVVTASDDAGVAWVSFTVDGSEVATVAVKSQPGETVSVSAAWNTQGIIPGTTHAIGAAVQDINNHKTAVQTITVKVLPAHCFDATLNADKGEIKAGPPACGGECGACAGASCTEDTDCASGVCDETKGVCIDVPKITNVSPQDGAPDTYVSLWGQFFGTVPGAVTFLGDPNVEGDEKTAGIVECSLGGGWKNNVIVVRVPAGAKSGPIEVKNNVGSDRTDDKARGPYFDPAKVFTVNDKKYPGICAVAPTQGEVGTKVAIEGRGFGSQPSVAIGKVASAIVGNVSDTLIQQAIVPPLAPGIVGVAVTAGGLKSNEAPFTVVASASDANPKIAAVDPAQGAAGTYLTITGTSFGTAGAVKFIDEVASQIIPADISFPEACIVPWKDTQVVVKAPAGVVPSGQTEKTWKIELDRTAPKPGISNRVDFKAVVGEAPPGLCSIAPDNGPVGTPVTVAGERFGDVFGDVVFWNKIAATASTDWSPTKISTAVPGAAQSGPVKVTTAQGADSSNALLFKVQDCRENAGICSKDQKCCENSGVCAPQNASCTAGPKSSVFAWQFSTGKKLGVPGIPQVIEQCGKDILASPSPWSKRQGGDAVCTDNVAISVLVSGLLDFKSLKWSWVTYGKMTPTLATSVSGIEDASDPSLIVERCVEGEAQCTQTERRLMQRKLAYADTDGDLKSEFDATHFLMSPADGKWFAPNSWYRVTLTTNIKNKEGGAMKAEPKCATPAAAGQEKAAYCFTFKTKEKSTCDVGDVYVSPLQFTATEFKTYPAKYAGGMHSADVCIELWPYGYNWSWKSGDTAKAAVSNHDLVGIALNSGPDGKVDPVQDLATKAETVPQKPVVIRAKAFVGQTQTGDEGQSMLTIKATAPEVTQWWPNCKEACINAAIGARYNVPLLVSTFSTAGVRLQKCKTFSCALFEKDITVKAEIKDSKGNLPSDDVATPDVEESTLFAQVDILPVASDGVTPQNLEKSSYYKASLAGGAKTATGKGASKFSWTFRTKDDGTLCAIDHVEAAPDPAVAYVVGQKVTVGATPFGKPDNCSAQGQKLVASSYPWSWNPKVVSNEDASSKVVTVSNLDLGAQKYGACTNQCLWAGSAPQSSIAVCGNGRVEQGEDCDPSELGQKGCNLSCLHIGSKEATCGNGKLEPALNEECDDGNKKDGDGCSKICIHEGSVKGEAVCGNGKVEATLGEDCDDGNAASGDGCSAACLNEGTPLSWVQCFDTAAFYLGADFAKQYSDPFAMIEAFKKAMQKQYGTAGEVRACVPVCGNSALEVAEQCDDGNEKDGDGCSAICLKEEKVAKLAGTVCGDAQIWGGEDCDYGVTDGKADPIQRATAIGQGTVENGAQRGTFSAAAQNVKGEAEFILQCGFTSDSQCAQFNAEKISYGVGSDSCCYLKADVEGYPQGPNQCRNTTIEGTFTTLVNPATLAGNVILAKGHGGAECPKGLTKIAEMKKPAKGFAARVGRAVTRIVKKLVGAKDASAQPPDAIFCAGDISITVNPIASSTPSGLPGSAASGFLISLGAPLEKDTAYLVRVKGGATGVKTIDGVILPDLGWSFSTSNEICSLDALEVAPLGETEVKNPAWTAKSPNETKVFEARPLHLKGGLKIPIAPIDAYSWTYGWAPPDKDANDKTVNPVLFTEFSTTTFSTAHARALAGEADIWAQAKITADTLTKSVGATRTGTAHVLVTLCDNPWPGYNQSALFADMEKNENRVPLGRGYTNYSFWYCRDAGVAAEPSDDLPALTASALTHQKSDGAPDDSGIFKEFFFTLPGAGSAKDAIGIRVYQNLEHLTPFAWYKKQSFADTAGTAKIMEVDGYEAIQVGNSIYIGGANVTDDESKVFTNIYLISAPPTISADTQAIIKQILQNFRFNKNLANANICGFTPTAPDIELENPAISCASDLECPQQENATRFCVAQNDKLHRDVQRIYDMQKIRAALIAAKGGLPPLTAGTFIPGLSTSKWPSWQAALGNALGAALPFDPVNRFNCATSTPLFASLEKEGKIYDPQTCWNAADQQFICPAGSHVYQYQYEGEVGGVKAATLMTDLEFGKWDAQAKQIVLPAWQDSLSATLDTVNQSLFLDFDFAHTCVDDTVYTVGGACGDGLVGSEEVCEKGQKKVEACNFQARLGATLYPTEAISQCQNTCEGWDVIPSGVKYCTNAGGETSGKVCAADTECASPHDICRTLADRPGCYPVGKCGDGILQGTEACDDGSQNGAYGHCNSACTGTDAAYCGNKKIDEPHELCDPSALTVPGCLEEVQAAAGLACTKKGPVELFWCSESQGTVCNVTHSYKTVEGKTQEGKVGATLALEEGDEGKCPRGTGVCVSFAQSETTEKWAIEKALSCTADCTNFLYCGDGLVTLPYEDCEGTQPCTTVDGKAGTRCDSVSCKYFEKDASGNGICKESGPPTPTGVCGNGIVDLSKGEQCDDGNTDNADACTNACKTAVCGDGFKYAIQEACDAGAQNTNNACTALYGSTCSYCTLDCKVKVVSGGFCGDGTVNGKEACDPAAICVNAKCSNTGAPCTSGGQCTTFDPPLSSNACPTNLFSACSSVCALQCVNKTGDPVLAGIDCVPLSISFTHNVDKSDVFDFILDGIGAGKYHESAQAQYTMEVCLTPGQPHYLHLRYGATANESDLSGDTFVTFPANAAFGQNAVVFGVEGDQKVYSAGESKGGIGTVTFDPDKRESDVLLTPPASCKVDGSTQTLDQNQGQCAPNRARYVLYAFEVSP